MRKTCNSCSVTTGTPFGMGVLFVKNMGWRTMNKILVQGEKGNGCWRWTGALIHWANWHRGKNRQGTIAIVRNTMHGPIPGWFPSVCIQCFNGAGCVNPHHLKTRHCRKTTTMIAGPHGGKGTAFGSGSRLRHVSHVVHRGMRKAGIVSITPWPTKLTGLHWLDKPVVRQPTVTRGGLHGIQNAKGAEL